MNADVQWTCNELISALIEGGAQGALIIGLIWACLKFCPKANAATRHGAWFATLLIAALLPIVIFAQSLAARFTLNQKAPASLETTSSLPPAPIEPNFDEVTIPDALAAEPPVPLVEATPDISPITPESTDSGFQWTIKVPAKISLILVACWLTLAAIRLGVLAAQLVALRKIKKLALPAPEVLAESFHAIVTTMGISRKPRLLISDKAIAPMVVGFFRPAMLLPKFITERCRPAQLEHLFRHELAHLARRDDWTNLLQQLIAAVFFFHPGILFVSRRLTAEREIACDDHALAISRAPRDYALFLTEFASQMKSRDFTAAPAAWSSKSQLKERIGMILNGKRNASPRVSRIGVGAISATAIALALAALAMTPRFVVAAEPPEPPEAPEAPVAVTVETAPEIAIAAVPAPPAIAIAPAQPGGLTIASVTPAREKFDVPSPRINVNVTPGPVRVAPVPRIAQAEPAEPRRPRRVERDGDDIERRLDRLEKMVEELVGREKRKGPGPDRPGWENNFNYKPTPGLGPEFDKQLHEQIEQAHREADRAKRDAERAVREQKMVMDQRMSADRQREWAGQMKLNADRESLKARKHALEEQRKHIEKELQALEKEIQNQDEAKRVEKERDKRNKADEKPEKLDKKTRDKDSDDDDRKAK